MRLIPILLVLWCVSLPSAGAEPSLFDLGELHFERVGADEKSVSGAITALAQDQAGFLWIGTQHGLVRHDGYRFRLFSHDRGDPASIGGNFVMSVWPAPDGRLWIGTRSSGLSVFDPRTERFESFRHEPDDPASLADDRVAAVLGDSEGGVWVATNDGLDHLDPATRRFTHHRHEAGNANSLNDNHVRALLLTPSGDLWVGTWDGLNRLRPGTGLFERAFSAAEDADSLAGHVVFRLLSGRDGVLWVGTPRKGAIRLDPETGTLTRLSPDAEPAHRLAHPWVTALAQPTADTVWVGTNGGGIAVVDAASGTVLRHLRHHPSLSSSLGHNDIGSMLVDASGLMWVGTWGAGLSRHNPTNTAFRALRSIPGVSSTLTSAQVLSVLELMDGTVWIGTQSSGIDVFDPARGRIGGFRHDPGDPGSLAEASIHSLAQTPDGTVWAGSLQSGLHRYRPETRDFARYTAASGLINDQVRRLLAGPDNEVWIGTYAGLSRWNPDTDSIDSFFTDDARTDPFDETVLALALQPDGTLWIGTDSGLFFLGAEDAVVQRIPPASDEPGSLSGDHVSGLLIDARMHLWLATPQGMDRLTELNGPLLFESVNSHLGQGAMSLGSNLLSDSLHRVWTATHRIDTEPWGLRRWTVADGVDIGTPWDGAHHAFRDGSLAIGGTEGLLVIRPEAFREWTFEPPVVVTELTVDGTKRLGAGRDPLVLEPDRRSFTVEFAALDFSLPARNRYSYRLDGYDPDWIETSAENRRATYTNLDPGEYTLRIRGSNRLGEWSPRTISLGIHRLPSWYQTLPIRGAALLLLMTVLWLSYRLRVRRLQASERRLHERVAEQTRELAEKNVQLESALERVREVSRSDPLTGLRNRRSLQDHIDTDTALARRHHREKSPPDASDLVFFLIDIDHFKAVNDQWGHAAGDAVLVQFVAILRECFREADILVRWGGEEFLAIARFINRSEAPAIAERVRGAVETRPFELREGALLTRTCSIGFAAFPFLPEQPDRVGWEEVVNIADVGLYAAKRSGRNAWVSLTAGRSLGDEELPGLLTDPGKAVSDRRVEVLSSVQDPTRIIW